MHVKFIKCTSVLITLRCVYIRPRTRMNGAKCYRTNSYVNSVEIRSHYSDYSCSFSSVHLHLLAFTYSRFSNWIAFFWIFPPPGRTAPNANKQYKWPFVCIWLTVHTYVFGTFCCIKFAFIRVCDLM